MCECSRLEGINKHQRNICTQSTNYLGTLMDKNTREGDRKNKVKVSTYLK